MTDELDKVSKVNTPQRAILKNGDKLVSFIRF